ncbi:MAG: hypothetical protein U0W40_13575 [Acidimicrobiia bacterium]
MRIAVIERFTGLSRRCTVEKITGPDDDTVVWQLDGPAALSPAVAWRAVVAWCVVPVGLRRRWSLLRACLAMRNWRRNALLRVPAWATEIAKGRIDEVVCFSDAQFPVAVLLASWTGRPLRRQLDVATKYLGEFAFEHLAVIPYAYWLHTQGRLQFTEASADTRCFYPFSPDHTEHPGARHYIGITEYPVAVRSPREFDVPHFPRTLDVSQWVPPPYRELYGDDARFVWPKPAIVVCNKTNEEPFLDDLTKPNTIDLPTLLELVRRLRGRYTVIYNRPTAHDIVPDHAAIAEPGDLEALRAHFPDVHLIQDLHAAHPELTFNELQLRVFASATRFVSVLGGSSYLASYFGGTNVVLAKEGWEVRCGAYDGWFRLFSGARLVRVADEAELLRTVADEWLTPEP